MTRTPSTGRTCSCGCTLRDTVVRPQTALRLAPHPTPTEDPTPARRRPVSRGCRCQACRPDRAAPRTDAIEAQVVRNVRRFGWHVVGVGAGDGGEPAFAYTVGLGHRCGQPDLLMSGQPVDLMAAALNDVAHRVVVDGRRLEAGDVLEGVLAWHPVVVDAVAASSSQDLLRYSSWFHRRPARALQLVWPDVTGLFPWQPGGHDTTDLQPPGWRRAGARTGGVAVDPGWELGTPADHLAVACHHVVLDGACPVTVLRVGTADRDQWVLLCERDEHAETEYAAQHLAHAVRGTPSLRALADLAVGQGATRRGPDDHWRRFPLR
ncbi:DUF4262 domain-containing protein [Jannaschia sp. R86511]|uniref:DUF4262 domain-containing protein n=1 Tax=Jannaschia sp. R86511 TaxID=3093853 RepID=UPI0036D2161C